MAYSLRAIIASRSDMERCKCQTFVNVIDLNQSYCMLPLTINLLQSIYNRSSPQLHISSFMYLKTSVLDWIAECFCNGTFALVENDAFGGVGEQSSLIWKDGMCIFGPIHTVTDMFEPYSEQNVPLDDAAVNQALRLLGVTKGEKDEFRALGLDRHRDTGDWKT